MGKCAEKTASDLKITRQENDQFCVTSYQRAIKSAKEGKFKAEIVPIKDQFGKDVLNKPLNNFTFQNNFFIQDCLENLYVTII